MNLRFAALLFALTLASCATAPAPYGPAPARYGEGYSDTQIEADRYRVSYRIANGPASRAQDLALLSAAELTLAHGFDWFVVTQRTLEGHGGYGGGPRVSFGVGGASFGNHSAVGVGAGFGLGEGGQGALTASLEIRLGRGAKPDTPEAYDARGVQAAIRR